MSDNPLELKELRFRKRQFEVLSGPETELFLRLALAANELMLQRRIVAAILKSEPQHPIVADIWLVQTFTALLTLVGKMHEALTVFDRLFLGSPLSKHYLDIMSDDGKKAVSDLKFWLGGSNMLALVRNKFSFHFHKDEPLKPVLDAIDPDMLLSLYFNKWDVNALNHFAAEPFLASLNRSLGSASTAETLTRLTDAVLPAKNAFLRFYRAFAELILLKMDGLEAHTHVLTPEDIPPLAAVPFPPLIQPDEDSPDR